jgi:hypothetical protein
MISLDSPVHAGADLVVDRLVAECIRPHVNILITGTGRGVAGVLQKRHGKLLRNARGDSFAAR